MCYAAVSRVYFPSFSHIITCMCIYMRVSIYEKKFFSCHNNIAAVIAYSMGKRINYQLFDITGKSILSVKQKNSLLCVT